MQVYLFQCAEHRLLDPSLSPLHSYYEAKIEEHADFILECSQEKPEAIINVPGAQLNDIASVHCDKWIEETALHMNRYASAHRTPKLSPPSSPRPGLYGGLPVITHKSFSGDASGVIGEALFVFVFTNYFDLNETDFAHFGVSKSTGIFPDFGIHSTSAKLRKALKKHRITGLSLARTRLIPAEVKATTSPSLSVVKGRLDKAIRQIRSFWRIRAMAERGTSIVFVALRNPSRAAYDGVIIWMD